MGCVVSFTPRAPLALGDHFHATLFTGPQAHEGTSMSVSDLSPLSLISSRAMSAMRTGWPSFHRVGSGGLAQLGQPREQEGFGRVAAQLHPMISAGLTPISYDIGGLGN